MNCLALGLLRMARSLPVLPTRQWLFSTGYLRPQDSQPNSTQQNLERNVMMNAVHRAGVTVFDPGASLTVENAHELLKLLRFHTTATVPNIVVNMKRTEVLDSTGIGALITSMRYVRTLNGGFALSNLSPELDRMLSLMNLHRTLDIFDSEDIAAEHLAHRLRP